MTVPGASAGGVTGGVGGGVGGGASTTGGGVVVGEDTTGGVVVGEDTTGGVVVGEDTTGGGGDTGASAGREACTFAERSLISWSWAGVGSDGGRL